MSRAKRFYLCNLIPLWEIDDERLEVDWTQGEAQVGDVVEMRVLVREIALNLETRNFDVTFDINESDFLLFGGLDDHMATLTTGQGSESERRPLSRLAESQGISPDERLRSIFASPARTANGQLATLIRAYWKVSALEDAAGRAEYYFDFKLTVGSDDYKERSDTELQVVGHGARFGEGLGLRGEILEAAQTLFEPAAPVICAAGFSKSLAALGEEVELIAVVQGGEAGQRLTFAIMSSAVDTANVLEIVEIPLVPGDLQRVSWRLPTHLAIENVNYFNLRAVVTDDVRNAFIAEDAAGMNMGAGQTIDLFGNLGVKTGVQIEVVDSRGTALTNVVYRFKTLNGNKIIAEGKTNKSGMIVLADLPETSYLLEVEGVGIIGTFEPEYVPPLPDTDNVIFSFVDVRLTAEGDGL